MATSLKVAGLVLALALAAPSYAEERPLPGDLAREGMEQIVEALRQMVDKIPLYEAPEILDNGDIIIRRKRPAKEKPEPPDDESAARI